MSGLASTRQLHGCPLDPAGAVETPLPTPEELRSLWQVMDPERVFLR